MKRFTARDGWTMQAYRFALDPSPAQERALWSHCGAARLAFNWGLAHVKAVMDQRAAEASYGIAAQDLAPASWTLPALRKAWNQAKDQVAPWWGENSKEAYNTGLDALARALGNWNESRTGKRKGPKIGFPRFKSRRKSTPTVRFTTGVIRIEPGRRHVTLPRLGTIRTHENTRKLQRRLAGGTARILSATVRRDRGGRWHVAFQAEVERAAATPARPGAVAGVDLGIKHLAVIGTGAGRHHAVDNPRHLEDALGGLRRAGRVLSRRAGPVVYDPVTGAKTFRQPSAGWLEAKNTLARAHARVARLRADALRKLTTTLARTYGTIVVEDLNVAGMLGPAPGQRLLRRNPAAARLQDRLERRPPGRRRPVVPQQQDLLGLPDSENQAVPQRPGLHLRALRPGPRPGRQRRTQPRRPRGDLWPRSSRAHTTRWKRPPSRPEDQATPGRWR